LKYQIKRVLSVLVRHRRPLFGISWLMVSYVFFALYIVMAFGAAVGEPVVSGVAYLLSGLVEERDIRPADRQSRRLGAWRRGLEIRSQWRAMLFIAAMVAGGAAAELTVGFVLISLAAAFVIRIIRSRQLQLDTAHRISPLGALESGRERLERARTLARRRDLSELPVQASVGVGGFFLSLPTATNLATGAAIALGWLWLIASMIYLGVIAVDIRRLRPAMLDGIHDREVLAKFLSYDPEVICYFNGHKGSMYAVDVWLRTFEASSKRIALVFRHRDVLSIDSDQLPAIVVPRDALCEKTVAPSTRVVFYPTNGTLNVHMQRDPRLSHVFLGHGDSDKAGSASPATRSYDRIWVSGSAGIERYEAAGLEIPREKFDVIGRPPLSPRIREMEELRLATDDDGSPFDRLEAELKQADELGKPPLTVLYAPTWEGYFDKSDYSSLAAFGPQLMAALLARHPGTRIIYKPHPMNGRRKEEMLLASTTIDEMLAEDDTYHPSTLTHSRVPLYRWFDYADILITDISSVLSDFMAWNRPYVVTNPRRLDISRIHGDFPSTRAAYVIDGVDIELDVDLITNAINHDPLAERRRRAMERYLGDPDRDPMDMFEEQLDRLWESQGPHAVDDETRALMDLEQST
jgi:hypothetical protein